ncbi:hypothetical protein RUND412_010899 [Rhizina undulata]
MGISQQLVEEERAKRELDASANFLITRLESPETKEVPVPYYSKYIRLMFRSVNEKTAQEFRQEAERIEVEIQALSLAEEEEVTNDNIEMVEVQEPDSENLIQYVKPSKAWVIAKRKEAKKPL